MKNRGALIAIVVVLVAAGGLWWWKQRSAGETPATSTVTQTRSGSGASSTTDGAHAGAADDAGTASVAITVTSDRGPVAGATVRLAPEEGDVIVVTADKTGVARATKLALGAWEISASATGYVPAALTRELAKDEVANLELALVAGGVTLSGTIMDATGGTVAAARVDAAKVGGARVARSSQAIATAFSAADGTYKVTVPEGQLIVAVSSPDYAAQSRHVDVGPAGATADFSLVPGGVIEGIVRDERTRQPVANAAVVAHRDGGGSMLMMAEAGRYRARTGADGRFRLSGLRPGAYELGARAGRLVTREATVVGLGVAEQVSDVELLLAPGLLVAGVVLDENDKPASGVDVTAGGRGRGGSAETDAKGAFEFVGLAPGSYFLMATSDEYVADGTAMIELVDKDLTGVTVRVRKGLQITGHVEPRQPCTISYDLDSSEFGSRMPMLVAPRSTDDKGEFTISPTTPAKATLTARCPSGAHGSLAIDTKAGNPPVVIDVKGAASIAGRVIDGKGNAVAGAMVMAAPDGKDRRLMVVNGMVTSGVQAMTNAQGAYTILGLEPGPYQVSALDRGRPLRARGTPVRVTLAAAEKKTGVDVAVDRPDGVIRGVVTGPDGRPLPDAWVSVHQDLRALLEDIAARERDGKGDGDDSSSMTITATNDGDGEPTDFAPVLTDANGAFQIAGLPHAKYEVIAEAQKGALRGRAANVTPDATLTIQALGLTTLGGTVRGAGGPVALFSVELEGPTAAARTFTDGKFQFGRVDPGTYKVRVSSKDGNAEVSVEVVPNQPATKDIVLVANAVVVGKVEDPDGKPLGGVAIVLIKDEGTGRTQVSLAGPPPTTNADGTFRIEGLAQPSALVVMRPPRPTVKRPLALEAGKTLDVGTIRVEPAPSPPP